jgi:hypothetical protein
MEGSMWGKLFLVLMAGIGLSGCAGRYVDLYVIPKPSSSDTVQSRIIATLDDLHTKGTALSGTYKKVSQEADLAQVPLVGVAVVSAVVAVNKPDNSADTLAKLGIGAGAYATLRGITAPTSGPESFRKAVDAINCVLVEGGTFVGQDVPANVKTLTDATVDLDSDAALLAASIATDVVIPTDAKKKEVELARANARLALGRATTASQAARVQIGAWENAPGELQRAAATIFSTLASRTSVRTVIDVSALAASWTTPAKTDGSGGAMGLAPGDADTLIARLNSSTDSLDRQSARIMSLAAGFQFVDRLKAVAKCPALI